MENKKYFLTVNGENVEVSKEVHNVYRSETEKIKYQYRKQKGVVVSYNYTVNVDGDEIDGEETIADTSNVSLDDDILNNVSKRELYDALNQLNEAEKDLIKSIYFYKNSERNYSELSGLSKTNVSYKKTKILKKLKKILEC